MPKTLCLIAAGAFALAALLIALFALKPPGPTDLFAVAVCAAAAGAALTLAYAARSPVRLDEASCEQIIERTALRVTQALAAAEARRETEAPLASVPAVTGCVTSIADVPAPGAAGKSRLGRGVAGLIQGTTFSSKTEDKPET